MFKVTIFFNDDSMIDTHGDVYQIDKKYFYLSRNGENSGDMYHLEDIYSIHFYSVNYQNCFLKYINHN